MIDIRQGTEDDLPAVYLLNRELLPEAWSEKNILRALRSGHELIVAEENGCIAAYLLSHDVLDEVHLLQIAVHPEFQRQGLATRLTHTLLTQKSGLSGVYLEVRASNLAAQQLYIALDFHIVGRRNGYYPPLQGQARREDAILMARPIDAMPKEHESV